MYNQIPNIRDEELLMRRAYMHTDVKGLKSIRKSVIGVREGPTFQDGTPIPKAPKVTKEQIEAYKKRRGIK